MLACLSNVFSSHQPATLDMLQTKLVRVKDGSTLNKDLFVTVVNEKRLFQNFVSDVARFMRSSLKLSNHNCSNVTQNCY